MCCLIQEEFKKLRRENKLIPILFCLVVLECLISYVIFRTCENETIESVIGKAGLNFYFFCGIQNIFCMISSMIVNYFLLTQEYIYDTWDLIITKVFDKRKICISKYAVFLLYQTGFNIVSVVAYMVVSNVLLPQNMNKRVCLVFVFIILTIHLFDATVQFCIQLKTGSFVMAAIGGLIYQVARLQIPQNTPIIKYTPIISEIYVFEYNRFLNVGTTGVCGIISVICCYLLVYAISKKFYS